MIRDLRPGVDPTDLNYRNPYLYNLVTDIDKQFEIHLTTFKNNGETLRNVSQFVEESDFLGACQLLTFIQTGVVT